MISTQEKAKTLLRENSNWRSLPNGERVKIWEATWGPIQCKRPDASGGNGSKRWFVSELFTPTNLGLHKWSNPANAPIGTRNTFFKAKTLTEYISSAKDLTFVAIHNLLRITIPNTPVKALHNLCGTTLLLLLSDDWEPDAEAVRRELGRPVETTNLESLELPSGKGILYIDWGTGKNMTRLVSQAKRLLAKYPNLEIITNISWSPYTKESAFQSFITKLSPLIVDPITGSRPGHNFTIVRIHI